MFDVSALATPEASIPLSASSTNDLFMEFLPVLLLFGRLSQLILEPGNHITNPANLPNAKRNQQPGVWGSRSHRHRATTCESIGIAHGSHAMLRMVNLLRSRLQPLPK